MLIFHPTRIFSTRAAQHCALDNAFVELIPGLYRNVSKTVKLKTFGVQDV